MKGIQKEFITLFLIIFFLGTAVEILQRIINRLYRVALPEQNKPHLTQCVLVATTGSKC